MQHEASNYGILESDVGVDPGAPFGCSDVDSFGMNMEDWRAQLPLRGMQFSSPFQGAVCHV